MRPVYSMMLAIPLVAGCGSDDSEKAPPPPPLPSQLTAVAGKIATMGGPLTNRGIASASGALKEKSGMVHRASRVTDQQNSTAWCEGASDDGVGQWVELSVPCAQDTTITGIGMVAGYASKESTFSKNNRVSSAQVTMHIGGEQKRSATVHFADTMKAQLADLGKISCPAGSTMAVRVTIAGVHAGTKYKDTCISELAVYAEGQAAGHLSADAGMVRGKDSCRTSGWSRDKDPNGLNVRSGPGKEHPVLGSLKPGDFMPEFKIVESKGGWLRIKNPSRPEPGPRGGSFSVKEGWVSGSLVGTAARSGEVVLHEKVRTKSAGTRFEMGDLLNIQKVVACSRGWLKVRGEYEGQKVSGWLADEDQCLNQMTNCN